MTIRELRAREKLTQAEFAKRIGIKPGTVSQLENGRMKVSDKIADRIWDEFGTEVGEMADQNGDFRSVPAGREYHPGGDSEEDARWRGGLLCPGGPEPDLVGPRRRYRRGGNLV